MIAMPPATAAPMLKNLLNFSKFKEIFTNL